MYKTDKEQKQTADGFNQSCEMKVSRAGGTLRLATHDRQLQFYGKNELPAAPFQTNGPGW